MNHWQIGDRALVVGVPEGYNGCDLNGSILVLTSGEYCGLVHIEHTKCRAGTAGRARTKYLRPIPNNFSRYHNELTEKGPCVYEWKERCNVDIG